MSRRRISAVVAGAVALTALSLPLAGAASADPGFAPAADDIVGVGSDTTEFALNFLADGTTVAGAAVPGYNAGRASARLASFNATGTTPITPKAGAAAIPRPNGSGAGKTALLDPANTSLNFARSSSSLSATEVSGGLFQVPFALDGLKLAVRAAGSNAPASITAAQLVSIYNGTVTDWVNVGGTAGAIHPLIPQAGSGTRAFFTAQLQAANGGAAVTLGGNVVETQEHSDVAIKDDPLAIAPFSTGRAKPLSTIKLLGGTAAGGFEAQRALYNVVRQADVGASWFGPIFGTAGFVCSAAAKPLIEAAGFDQLALPAAGGVCGSPTQAATTNFATTQPVVAQATTTTLTAAAKGQTVTLTARVAAASGIPAGAVKLFDGATQVATANLSGGTGLATLTGVAKGAHTYKASFTPSSGSFLASDSAAATVTVTVPVVKKASRTSVVLKSRFKAGTRMKAVIKVTVNGKAAKGKVVVTMKARRLGQAVLKRGKATVRLPKLKRGKHTIVFTFTGNATTRTSRVVKKVVTTA